MRRHLQRAPNVILIHPACVRALRGFEQILSMKNVGMGNSAGFCLVEGLGTNHTLHTLDVRQNYLVSDVSNAFAEVLASRPKQWRFFNKVRI